MSLSLSICLLQLGDAWPSLVPQILPRAALLPPLAHTVLGTWGGPTWSSPSRRGDGCRGCGGKDCGQKVQSAGGTRQSGGLPEEGPESGGTVCAKAGWELSGATPYVGLM